MSVAAPATLTLKPKKRTEYEVASDVIVALIDGGFIKRDPEVIARIATKLEIPVGEIQQAWRRRVDGKVYPLTSRPVEQAAPVPTPPAPARETPGPKAWKQKVTPKQRANLTDHVGKRKAAKEPVEGIRVCSAPCHEGERLIPRSEFRVKDKAKGTLRAWCKRCMRIYVKSRYLSSEQLDRLGAVLQFVLGEGDEHVGSICPDCNRPCAVGDEVVAPASELHHARCVPQDRSAT